MFNNRGLAPQVNDWVNRTAQTMPALQNVPQTMPVQANVPPVMPQPNPPPQAMQHIPTALPPQAAPIAQNNFAQNRPVWPGARMPTSFPSGQSQGFAVHPRTMNTPNGY